MNLFKPTIAVILLLVSSMLFSQSTITGELRKWHTVTLTFDGPNTSETNNTNPFLDYRLNLNLTSPTGKTFTIPGFYAADGNAAETSASSGNKWRVRFTPNETGEWTYAASFRTGANVAVSVNTNAGNPTSFDGNSGTFNISSTNKALPDHRANGRLNYVGERYLQFEETGTYFLKAGSDSPENLLAYDDFDNTVNKKTWSPHAQDWNSGDPTWKGENGKELIGAINYLAEKGMNAFSFLTMNVIGDGKDVWPWAASNHGNLNGNSGTDAGNRLRYDVSKLAQWEVLFSHADTKGMYLHFKTQETENDQLLDGGELGTQRKLYYRELIARFGHHLALNWNLGEEHDLYQELNDSQNTRVKAYASFIKSIDPYDHHIVIHSYPGTSTQNALYNPLLGNGNELTGPSIQSQINNVHQDVKRWIIASKNAGKQWVVANDEQGGAQSGVTADASYNGSKGSQADNRKDTRHKVLWGTLMAGGAGVEYYFGYQTGETDLTAQDFRSRDVKWNDAKVALDFFNDNLSFWEMETHDEITSSASDFCLAKLNETYAIYFPNGGSTNLNLTDASGTFTVKWFNPVNGGSLVNGSVTELNGGGNRNIGNPPKNTATDWVALVEKRDDETTPIPVTGISVSPEEASIEEGNTLNLSAEILPADATNKNITWSSTDNNIASVDEDGRVTAKNEGNVTITATSEDGSFTDTSVIEVTAIEESTIPVDQIEITPQTASIEEGDTLLFSYVISPSDATNQNVNWSSSDESIATVNQNGLVTAVNAGNVSIAVTSEDGNKTNSVTIAVTEEPEVTVEVTRIYVTPQRVTLEEGETAVISYQVWPSNATNKDVTWFSEDETIATVDENGQVTALNVGVVEIVALSADGGFRSDSRLTVIPSTVVETISVTGIVVSPESETVEEGSTLSLGFQITPANATNKNLSWSSSDDSIATVDSNGLISALKIGEVTITAETEDGNFTAAASIVVTEKPEELISVTRIYVTPQRVILEEGETAVISYRIWPSNATNKDVTWFSEDETIATVDENGEVTALSEGVVEIVALSVDGSFRSDSRLTVIPSTVVETISVTGITINPESAAIESGSTFSLGFQIAPSNASNKEVTWSSSDETVATVNQNGVVSAIGEGVVFISVSSVDGDFGSSSTITVLPETANNEEPTVPLRGVYVRSQRVTLEVNKTFEINYYTWPSNATNKNIIWSSTNTSIATVDENGLVTAHRLGFAKIVATTEEGQFKSDASLTVIAGTSSAKQSVIVYPNPTSDEIRINGEQVENGLVELYSLNGTLLQQKETKKGEDTILSLAEYHSGTYMVKILNLENTISKSVVKL